MTIIDFNGVPFEVPSISVSLIAGLVFDCAFHYFKIYHDNNLNSVKLYDKYKKDWVDINLKHNFCLLKGS